MQPFSAKAIYIFLKNQTFFCPRKKRPKKLLIIGQDFFLVLARLFKQSKNRNPVPSNLLHLTLASTKFYRLQQMIAYYFHFEVHFNFYK